MIVGLGLDIHDNILMLSQALQGDISSTWM
jgi:hypothetical protein